MSLGTAVGPTINKKMFPNKQDDTMDSIILGTALIMPTIYGFSLLLGLVFSPGSDDIHD